MQVNIQAVAQVKNQRKTLADDHWGEVVSEIHLEDTLSSECFDAIDDFSHLQVIFYFDQVDPNQIVLGSEHPRENLSWPKVGIFAQRKKSRPNCIGSTMVRLLKREGRVLWVAGLDAIDGTAVLDIKPVMHEFLPREEVKQPPWASELMSNYW